MSKAKGIWVDGRASKEEIQRLQDLIKEAAEKCAKGELPWNHREEKLTVSAWIETNVYLAKTLHFYYSWKFPPKEQWKQEGDSSECAKCYPNGPEKEPDREVWCEHIEYNACRCPYGVREYDKHGKAG